MYYYTQKCRSRPAQSERIAANPKVGICPPLSFECAVHSHTVKLFSFGEPLVTPITVHTAQLGYLIFGWPAVAVRVSAA